MVKYIIGTSAFWLLLAGYGLLYGLFALGWEIRLPAANAAKEEVTADNMQSVWDAVERPAKHHR